VQVFKQAQLSLTNQGDALHHGKRAANKGERFVIRGGAVVVMGFQPDIDLKHN